jgi:hypothetical protein
MKKMIFAVLLLLLIVGVGKSDAVMKVFGLTGECSLSFSGCTVIPLTPTTLCTISCPQQTSFSYTDANRFWGASTGVGSCLTSTNGGITWVACATQPFTTGNREFYAGAADGSVIAVGTTTGPTTCTIKKSTNNGASWSTVFTALQQCTSGSLEGQRLFCLSDDRCGFIGWDATTVTMFRSNDDGDNWVQGETSTGGNCAIPSTIWNGTAGFIPSQNTGCGGGSVAKAGYTTIDSWLTSSVWSGTQGSCWNAVIYNGAPRAICQVGGANYTMNTETGAVANTLVLPGVSTGADSGGVALTPFANTMYIVATKAASGIGIWVSRDSLASFTMVGSFGGGGAGPRGGNSFFANGCIYFTTGQTAMFGKVC